MRKPLGLNADGSVTVPAEMVRDLVGAARELILEQRDSCIILSPLKVSLQGGNLPKLLAAYHEPESIDTVLEKRFKRSGEGKAQFQGDLEVLALNDVDDDERRTVEVRKSGRLSRFQLVDAGEEIQVGPFSIWPTRLMFRR